MSKNLVDFLTDDINNEDMCPRGNSKQLPLWVLERSFLYNSNPYTITQPRTASPVVHLVDATRVCFIVKEHTHKCSSFYHTCVFKMHKVYSFIGWNMYLFAFPSSSVPIGLMKLDETICSCWCWIVMKWALWLQQVVAMVVWKTIIYGHFAIIISNARIVCWAPGTYAVIF